MKGRKPIVFYNTFIEQWPARKLWNIEHLSRKFGHMQSSLKIYKSSDSVFGPNWRIDKPMSGIDSIQWETPYVIENVTRKSFFEHLSSKDDDDLKREFWYYQDDFDGFTEGSFEDIGYGLDQIVATPEKVSIGIWIGEKGVTTHAHYDSYYNVYAQISGRKKFTLVSPMYWMDLKPFPFCHPSFAQSQVGLGGRSQVLFSGINQTEIILEPGDILYIPPLWWHEVIALEDSISVNSWSDAEENDLLGKIWNFFEDSANQFFSNNQEINDLEKHRISLPRIVYQKLITILKIRITESDQDISFFAKQVIQSQFRDTFSKGYLSETLLSSQLYFWCTSKEVEMDMNVKLFSSTLARDLGTLFKLVPIDTREILLSNFIEFMSYWATGDPKKIGAFIHHCIAS